MSKVTKEQNKAVVVLAKVTSKVTPFLQVVIALLALVVLLGLAVKGAAQHLTNISEVQRLIAAIVVVVLLAYAIGTGLRNLLK